MSDDDLNELFENFFESGPTIPPPTPEEERMEAMTITELHLNAFYLSDQAGKKEWYDMLPEWLAEFKHYLPVLEEHEEYEQCAKVFKAMKEIRETSANHDINKALDELEIQVTNEADQDELDF